MKSAAPAALVAAAAMLAVAPAASAGVQRGVVYGTGKTETGSKRLLLDLYQPSKRSTAKRPVVILIHGGGFRNGSRSQADLAKVADGLVKQGAVVASIDYRLMGDNAVNSARVKRLSDAVPKVAIYTAMVATTAPCLTSPSATFTRSACEREPLRKPPPWMRITTGRFAVDRFDGW